MAAVVEALEMDMLSVLYSKLQPFGQSIYNRRTNAVETARYLISAAAELSACVKNGINNGSCGYALLGVDTRRNTTSVIRYLDNIPLEDIYGYLRAVACSASSIALSTISYTR